MNNQQHIAIIDKDGLWFGGTIEGAWPLGNPRPAWVRHIEDAYPVQSMDWAKHFVEKYNLGDVEFIAVDVEEKNEWIRVTGLTPIDRVRAVSSTEVNEDRQTKTIRRSEIIRDIFAERNRQNEIWGGAEHDNKHGLSDWIRFIGHQVNHMAGLKPSDDPRERLVRVAALAVAAMESYLRKDRTAAPESEEANEIRYSYCAKDLSYGMFFGNYATREEAASDAFAESPNVNVVMTGRCIPFAMENVASGHASEMIDRIVMRTIGRVGQVANRFLDEVTGAQIDDLDNAINGAIIAWADRNDIAPDFYEVEDEQTHTRPVKGENT